MNDTEKYLKILELDCNFKTLSKKEQEKALALAWKKFSLKYHPDINKSANAEKIFKLGNEANEKLKECVENDYFESNFDYDEPKEENTYNEKYWNKFSNQNSNTTFKKVAMTLAVILIALLLIIKTDYKYNHQANTQYSNGKEFIKEEQENPAQNEDKEYTSSEETESTPDWDSYVKDFENKIKENWFPPKSDTSKYAEVEFVISKDGSILENYIKTSSGDEEFDRIALEAVNNTTFSPLPEEYKGESVPAEFSFEYNVKN